MTSQLTEIDHVAIAVNDLEAVHERRGLGSEVARLGPGVGLLREARDPADREDHNEHGAGGAGQDEQDQRAAVEPVVPVDRRDHWGNAARTIPAPVR